MKKYGKFIKIKGKLLDVGCGTGGFLRFARNYDFDLYGFDASEAQVSYAHAEFKNVRRDIWPSEYVKNLKQDGLKFQFVTFWDTLEHIEAPLDFLSQIADIIDRKGILFISTPNGEAIKWKKLVYFLMGKPLQLVPWEHLFYFTPRSLKLLINKTGFRVLEIGSVACYVRNYSAFEICRRIFFSISRFWPNISPQIYAIARRM